VFQDAPQTGSLAVADSGTSRAVLESCRAGVGLVSLTAHTGRSASALTGRSVRAAARRLQGVAHHNRTLFSLNQRFQRCSTSTQPTSRPSQVSSKGGSPAWHEGERLWAWWRQTRRGGSPGPAWPGSPGTQPPSRRPTTRVPLPGSPVKNLAGAGGQQLVQPVSLQRLHRAASRYYWRGMLAGKCPADAIRAYKSSSH
jgi:hypothetical protein